MTIPAPSFHERWLATLKARQHRKLLARRDFECRGKVGLIFRCTQQALEKLGWSSRGIEMREGGTARPTPDVSKGPGHEIGE
jgi:hypothetical protein